MSDWRKDPTWKLVSYESGYWTSPPEQVTDSAELCGDGAWASAFDGHHLVATWFRVLPITQPREKA